MLASADFPAAGEVFQGAAGFFQTFYQQEGDYAQLLDQLGSRFEIVLVGPKPFPSCRYTHCAVTGVLDLVRKHSIKARDIQEVRVQIGERDMRSVGGWSEDEKKKKHRPEGVVDAQFSIPYTVAATLVSGGLSLEEFTDAKLRSEEILDLAARVKTDSHAGIRPRPDGCQTASRRDRHARRQSVQRKSHLSEGQSK